jgi:hypothetical protein
VWGLGFRVWGLGARSEGSGESDASIAAQLVACGDGQRLEVEKNILNGRLKAVTAYYGSCWQFTTSKH